MTALMSKSSLRPIGGGQICQYGDSGKRSYSKNQNSILGFVRKLARAAWRSSWSRVGRTPSDTSALTQAEVDLMLGWPSKLELITRGHFDGLGSLKDEPELKEMILARLPTMRG